MPRDLRADALRIWRAGVDAVRSERLMSAALRVVDERLFIGDHEVALSGVRRMVVVGAGKAGAGMSAAVEEILGERLMTEKRLVGWVNVPADCVRPLSRIRLHAARPAGVNEPTAEGQVGAEEILRLVGSLGPDDLCLCLLSGGASALLPSPVEGVSLADKLALTRALSAAGANIRELNTVRKQLSRIKGGGLARACPAGRLFTLIISDVLGDPLDVIGSGPTVANRSTAADALEVARRFEAAGAPIPPAIMQFLARAAADGDARDGAEAPRGAGHSGGAAVVNLVIGNNALAVDAAGEEAVRLGYSPALVASRTLEGDAERLGRELAQEALCMRNAGRPDCLISGGEPVVRLAPESIRGRGGRNQQLVLAAVAELWNDGGRDIVILSGGTDGEDGPTDAAGALLEESLIAMARSRPLNPADFLSRSDAYHFFAPLGGLIHTGPTHTNVCDLRVALIRPAGERDPASDAP